MNFELRLHKYVVSVLDWVDRPTEKRLRARIEELGTDPFDPRISAQLAGKAGLRRSRVGKWRIVYEADVDVRAIYILAIQPRGQIYQRL